MQMTTPSELAERCENETYANHVLLGAGEQVLLMKLQISRIAPHFRTVLITGEGGTGKRAIARELHRLSAHSACEEPFVVAEISSFAQGAVLIEPRGTLFLEGLDQLEPAMQEGLADRLRTIQRQRKIVISSDCEVRSLMATGRLRQTLASRIGGLEIRAVALRDRSEDIASIAGAMLQDHGSRAYFSAEALRIMSMQKWSGNFLELWNFVAQFSSHNGEIGPQLLPEFAPARPIDHTGVRLDKVMQRHVFEVLQRCSGNKLKTAEALGISRSTLYRMLGAAAG